MLIWLKFPQRKFNIDCFGLKVITRHLFAYKLKKDKMDASLLHLWLSNILKQLPLGQVCAHSSCFFFNIWYIFHFSDSSCQKSKKSWFVSWERTYFYKPTQIMSLKTCFSSFVIRTKGKKGFFSVDIVSCLMMIFSGLQKEGIHVIQLGTRYNSDWRSLVQWSGFWIRICGSA